MKKPLSETEPLSLMISSRCNDKIEYQGEQQSMAVLRRDLKLKLEEIKLGGRQVFRVWIHEDESNASAVMNNWDACLEKARNADVFIVLYNGRCGWLGNNAPVKDGLGICHAELSAAFDKAPPKVRSIQFKDLVLAPAGTPDAAFQGYVAALKIPGAQVKTGEEALQRVDELAAAIVLSLAREGVGVSSSGNYYAGEALEWSRMNFPRRRRAMTAAVVNLLRQRDTGKVTQPADNVAAVAIRDSTIGFICDSIPASMSTAAARELVGQPFLHDHELAENWNSAIVGPVHVIACQKNVSEAQAVRQLGFPDAIVVSAPFGVYVADDVQKIQMTFIANCRDETTTREKVQSFLNWLIDYGEVEYLVKRATQRRQISDFLRNLRDAKDSNRDWAKARGRRASTPVKP